MPRYYFTIKNGIILVPDDTGRELRDFEEARAEAANLAVEVRRGLGRIPNLVPELRVEIRNSENQVVGWVDLAQAVSSAGK